jgi:hypothetical protein
MASFRPPFIPDVPPLPRRSGFSYYSTSWGMMNRDGANLLNRAQLLKREFSDGFGGIRLACSLVTTSTKDQP